MRIGIDARCIKSRLCGVSQFARCLLEALAAIDSRNQYFIFTAPDKTVTLKLGSNFSEIRVDLPRYSAVEHVGFKSVLKAHRLDLFHSLHSYFPLLLPRGNVRTVLTLHDVFAARHSWFFEGYGPLLKHAACSYFRLLAEASVRQADAIVTVSQYSRQEILNFLKPRCEIHVVHNAVAPEYNAPLPADGPQAFRTRLNLPEKFILFLGNFKRYKNVDNLLAAFAKMKKNSASAGIFLVLAGNDRRNEPRIRSLAARLGVQQDVLFPGYVADEDLPALYQAAALFVLPSLWEGFGIPALEAMACGTPVLTGNSGPFPEIVADAALQTDPLDIDKMACQLSSALNDSTLRHQLIRKGKERVSLFSWTTAARQYLDIYERTAGK